MVTPADSAGDDHEDGRPPVGGSWRTLYLLVIVNLAVLVLLFYVFTRAFS